MRPNRSIASRTPRDWDLMGSAKASRRRGGDRTQDAVVAQAAANAAARAAAEAAWAAKMRGEPRRTGEAKSTWWRNRRQLAPHLVAFAVLGLAMVLQIGRWLAGDGWTDAVAVWVVLATAGLVAGGISLTAASPRWRLRAATAALVATAWLVWCVRAGVSWGTVAAWAAGYHLLAARWWQSVRHAHPDGPPEQAPATTAVEGPKAPARDDVPGCWAWYVASDSGPLPGTWLHDRQDSDHAQSYTVQLMPGRHSLGKAIAKLDVIASGLRRPISEVLLEAHGPDSSQLRLTVVTSSPITDAVCFTEPMYRWDGPDLWVELGTWADGAGRTEVQLLAANSARHLLLIGGQGSGKSALLNLLALIARATGVYRTIYLDGQDGASSPQLLAHAGWSLTGVDGGKRVRRALRRIFDARAKVLRAKRWAGWQTSSTYPALLVIIDECHLVLDPRDKQAMAEWVDLASTARKLGVSFVFATQHPGLESLGNSDKLRSLLQQYTTIVLRTTTAVGAQILRLPVDPSTLPAMPGYGYVIAGARDKTRTAPWRADFLDDADGVADGWFSRYPEGEWDTATATAAGEDYQRRHDIAAAEQAAVEAEVEALEAGIAPADPFKTDAHSAPVQPQASPGRGLIAAAPTCPGRIPTPRPAETDQIDSASAIYAAIAAGATRPVDIARSARLSLSRTYDLLTDLETTGRIVKTARGRWAPADSDAPGIEAEAHSELDTPERTF